MGALLEVLNTDNLGQESFWPASASPNMLIQTEFSGFLACYAQNVTKYSANTSSRGYFIRPSELVEINTPNILGVSDGEFEFFGYAADLQRASASKSYRLYARYSDGQLEQALFQNQSTAPIHLLTDYSRVWVMPYSITAINILS